MDIQGTTQVLGNLGEFVGAIAVVVTLIYLAAQVRQSRESMDANTSALEENRRLTRNQILQELSRRTEECRYRATENTEATSIFVRGNADPDNLNEVEREIFVSRISPYFMIHMMFHAMVQEEFLEPQYLDFVDADFKEKWGTTTGARQFWAEYQHLFPHREHVNALLQESE
jgi:hypothetical protein